MSLTDEQFFALLQMIQDMAKTSVYDKISLGVAAVSVIIAAVVAVFTYAIYKKQVSIMEKQAVISREQTTISKEQTAITNKQTEIMVQQNAIALYRERYNVYLNVSKLLSLKDSFQQAATSGTLNGKMQQILSILITQFAVENPYKPGSKAVLLHIIEQEILCGEFLFPNGKAIVEFCEATIGCFRKFAYKGTFTEEDLEKLVQMVRIMEEFSGEEFSTMKSILQVSRF